MRIAGVYFFKLWRMLLHVCGRIWSRLKEHWLSLLVSLECVRFVRVIHIDVDAADSEESVGGTLPG